MNGLTENEKVLLDKIEDGGIKAIAHNRMLWCYLDGKRHNCKTFDERLLSFIMTTSKKSIKIKVAEKV